MITIHTTISMKLGVPGLSFIGLCGALGLVVTLKLGQQNHAGAAHHVLVGSLLLVAFSQSLTGLACVGLITAWAMGPTVVELETFTLGIRGVGRAHVVGLGLCNSGGMVGSMKSDLLRSELMATFDILFVEVSNEVV